MQRTQAARQRDHGPESERSDRLPGQVVVLFALFSVVLIGFLALAVDAGYLMSKRREMQNAADAAALAGAVAALNGESAGVIDDSVMAYALENADIAADDVEIHQPPEDGPFEGDSEFIQVKIETDVEKFFLGAVYTGDWKVGASATAGIVVQGWSTGLLALNPDEGGIDTSGSTTITVDGASIISNYNLDTSGNTVFNTSEYIMANDGHIKSGSWVANAGKGTNFSAPEVPDPLLDLLDPPSLPAFIGNPVPVVDPYPESTACITEPAWWPDPSGPDDPGLVSEPGQYVGSGSCINLTNAADSYTYRFRPGQWRFISGAGISSNRARVLIEGGTWNFQGGPGLSIQNSTVRFEVEAGYYSFTNGAGISIGGSALNNIFGSGASDANDHYMYFGGGGGLSTGGSNDVTLYPGTYIFNGGPGLSMSGNADLRLESGTYEFWFNDGADMSFSGSSRIVADDGVYVTMYFNGDGGNPANLQMSGNTSFNIPSGEYYFDNGQMRHTGSSWVYGEEVFLYFTNGGYLHSTGSADFSFTAPDTMIYPGYYPGVFMYSDRSNSATFQWFGRSDNESRGIVYLPSSPMTMGGASNAKNFTGQMIVDRLSTSGNTVLAITYEEFVSTEVPAVFLVE